MVNVNDASCENKALLNEQNKINKYVAFEHFPVCAFHRVSWWISVKKDGLVQSGCTSSSVDFTRHFGILCCLFLQTGSCMSQGCSYYY